MVSWSRAVPLTRLSNLNEVTNSGKPWANGKTYTYKANAISGLFEAETEDGQGSSLQKH